MLRYSFLTLFSIYIGYSSNSICYLYITESVVFLSTWLYWLNPIYGLRRNIDIFCTIIAFTYHVYICILNKLFFSIILYLISACNWPLGLLYQSNKIHSLIHIFGNMANLSLYLSL